MRLELRMKYLEKTYKRYKKAPKESKSKILDGKRSLPLIPIGGGRGNTVMRSWRL